MRRGLALMIPILALGLTSASCKSASATSSLMMPSVNPNPSSQKVRIAGVSVEGAELGEAAGYNQLYSYVQLQTIATEKYPSLFSMDNASTPILEIHHV